MRARFAFAAVLATLAGAGALYAAAASGGGRIARCSLVSVSGGNFNGLTGGVIVAAVQVENLGKRDCTINSRPWIRLGRLPHPVTVADAAPGSFGRAGDPQRTVRLSHGQHAVAQVFIAPGSCSRARSVVFALRARAGWGKRSVPISNAVCDDGTGTIWVGSFRR
jgi:hypothetical protein